MKGHLWLLCFLTATWFSFFTQAYTKSLTEIIKHTDSLDPDKDGFWSERNSWKHRWVKYWAPRKIYVPIWKKVWSPVIQKEWVPLPNPPPGWTKPDKNLKVTEYKY